VAETSRQERLDIARRRLLNILRAHTIALGRTLEQKIADAGPYNQRIDPHVLTQARHLLEHEGRILRLPRANTPWFHLSTAAPAVVAQRLAEQEAIHHATQDQRFTRRMGQTLEIAVYKALRDQDRLEYFGHFLDLEAHDDSQPYQKVEPPAHVSQRAIPGGKRFDFLLQHPTAGWTGVEVKNVREWLYPDRDEVKDMLAKACALDAVPVLIARRIPFVTFHLLYPCGLVIWQTYRQRYPAADQALAAQAADKRLLGYFDIRVGNEPDVHLQRFIQQNLPDVLPRARERFEAYKDLLGAYSTGTMSYPAFAARVRRRQSGVPEDDTSDAEAPREEEW